MKEFVLGLVFDPKREHIILIDRLKDPYNLKLNGIGGKVDFGETPELAIQRELKEETGFSMDEILLCDFVLTVEFKEDSSKLHVFYIKLKDKFPIRIHKTHEGTFAWHKLSDVNLLDGSDEKIAGDGSMAFFTKFILERRA